MRIGELALLALHACSLCSCAFGDEPADLTPLYAAMESQPVATASETASLSALYELCEVTDCNCGAECDCDGCDRCPCGEMPLEKKLAKKVEVLTGKLATLQAKLDDAPDVGSIADRFEQLLARIDNARQLPSDDPPPRPDAEPAKSTTRLTQWLIVTAPGLPDGTPEIEAALVPKGWELSKSPEAHLRKRCVTEDPGVIAELQVEKLPAYILAYDGKEIERTASEFPGWKYLADRWIAVSTGKGKPAKPPTPANPQSAAADYPVRGGWWSHPGGGRAGLINHLMNGQHAGKFSRSYLDSLDMAELESLHSDDHERRLKTTATSSVAVSKREPIYERRKVCTGNGCYYVNVHVGWKDAPL